MPVSQWFFYSYGTLALVGGVIGYVVAGSQASLIAGSLSGLMLLAATALRPKFPGVAAVALAIVSAVLLAKFGNDYANTAKLFPAGVMAAFSLAALLYLAGRLLSKPKAP